MNQPDRTSSLLQELEREGVSLPATASAAGRGGTGARGSSALDRLGRRVLAPLAVLWSTPRARKRSAAAGVFVLVAACAGAWWLTRPAPKPDYTTAPLDVVFNYTLLTEDFNSLPVDERLRLLGQLIDRLKNMSASDSMLLAAFAASVEKKAREQLERNASRVMIDVWDEYAADYADVPPEDREAFLDDAFIKMTKMAEALAGSNREVDDATRLAEAREQAARDREAIKSGRTMNAGQTGRVFRVLQEDIGGQATPQERARAQLMVRDMTRRLRGEPVPGAGGASAPPKPTPPPPPKPGGG